jgi:hypothetical protein
VTYSVSDSDEAVGLQLSRRQLTGLRHALLEAVTDLVFTDAEAQAEQLRSWLAEVTADDEGAGEDPVWEDPLTGARARLSTVGDGRYQLFLPPAVLDVAIRAIDHVNVTVFDFEIPMRLRVDAAELAELTSAVHEAGAAGQAD